MGAPWFQRNQEMRALIKVQTNTAVLNKIIQRPED